MNQCEAPWLQPCGSVADGPTVFEGDEFLTCARCRADLDDFEVKDTRILTPGTGFTVGPGLYFAGQFGVRTEVSVYLAPSGPEITTPAQDDVEPLLK